MASRLMRNRSRVVAYLPSLRAAVRHFRAFSSYDENPATDQYVGPEAAVTETRQDLPDPRMGPLNADDKRFPLPGLAGPSPPLQDIKVQADLPPVEPDILTANSPDERRLLMLHNFLNMSKLISEEESQGYINEEKPSPLDVLECAAQDCPQLVRKDFQDLFPERDLSQGNMTVITLSQKTENDMSGWSPDIENEREELLQNFIMGAQDICTALNSAGYWADFIDPSSGIPYLGPYTNSSLYETDERYRYFGFEIDDLGCCKVISHHVWGTHAYVGCLFTTAPVEHPVIKELNKKSDN